VGSVAKKQKTEQNSRWHEAADELCDIFTVLLRRTEDEAGVVRYNFEHQRSQVIDIQALLLGSVLRQTQIIINVIIITNIQHSVLVC